MRNVGNTSTGAYTVTFPISFSVSYGISRQIEGYSSSTDGGAKRARDIELTSLSTARFWTAAKDNSLLIIGV